MAVKKTELYSSLWASCDALRYEIDRLWSTQSVYPRPRAASANIPPA